MSGSREVLVKNVQLRLEKCTANSNAYIEDNDCTVHATFIVLIRIVLIHVFLIQNNKKLKINVDHSVYT